MIGNLIKMIITGSYNSFICKDHGDANERNSSGTLKIKIVTSIVVVAAIGLLRDFSSSELSSEIVLQKIYIFAAFLIGALVLGVLEYMHVLGEKIEHDLHANHQSNKANKNNGNEI